MTDVESAPAIAAEPEVRWVRSSVDLANIVVGLMVLAGIIATAVFLEQATRGMSEDVVEMFSTMPPAIDELILGLAQLLLVATPIAIAAYLVWRRMWACLGVLALAAAIGGAVGASAFSLLDDVIPRDTVTATRAHSFVTGAAFPSPAVLAGAAAVVTAAAPWLTRRYRRAAWIALVGLGLARIVTTTSVPTTVAGMLAAGFVAGSVTLLITGSPWRRPRTVDVVEAVRRAGVEVSELTSIDIGADQSSTFVGRRPDGSEVFVKAVDADHRDAQLLFRTFRVLRVKGLEDEPTNRSSVQTVERAALGAMLARRAGAHPPEVVAVGETRDKASVLVTERVAGRRLAELDADEVTDALLDDLWDQVGMLGDARIAHRWLSSHHILATSDDRAMIVDYRWSILGANDAALGADVAEMLSSLALIVGPDRAVASARRRLDDDALARALPLLQPLALSRDTRARLHEHEGILQDLQDGVQQAVGVAEVELASLRRVTAWTLLTWVGVFVLGSFVLAVASNLEEIGDALATMEWRYVPVIIVCTALTYVFGAILLIGSATVPLPFALTSWVMLAQSFLNRFTPAGWRCACATCSATGKASGRQPRP